MAEASVAFLCAAAVSGVASRVSLEVNVADKFYRLPRAQGSHKANMPVPAHMRDLSKSVHPTVKPIPAKAGDCIIFTYAEIHQPWAQRHELSAQ